MPADDRHVADGRAAGGERAEDGDGGDLVGHRGEIDVDALERAGGPHGRPLRPDRHLGTHRLEHADDRPVRLRRRMGVRYRDPPPGRQGERIDVGGGARVVLDGLVERLVAGPSHHEVPAGPVAHHARPRAAHDLGGELDEAGVGEAEHLELDVAAGERGHEQQRRGELGARGGLDHDPTPTKTVAADAKRRACLAARDLGAGRPQGLEQRRHRTAHQRRRAAEDHLAVDEQGDGGEVAKGGPRQPGVEGPGGDPRRSTAAVDDEAVRDPLDPDAEGPERAHHRLRVVAHERVDQMASAGGERGDDEQAVGQALARGHRDRARHPVRGPDGEGRARARAPRPVAVHGARLGAPAHPALLGNQPRTARPSTVGRPPASRSASSIPIASRRTSSPGRSWPRRWRSAVATTATTG